MGKRVTQMHVAELAGVSQAAVSVVLGGGNGTGIPEETVERIQQAARQLGYVPNRLARALKTQKAMTIACVVPDITNPFYPSLFKGVQRAARERGYDVLAVDTDGEAERERAFLSWVLQGGVDGVVGVFFHLTTKDIRPLVERGIHVVRIEASAKKGGALPIDDIYIDSKAAAGKVVESLIAKGHRRIAIIAGTGGPEAARVAGYKMAMDAAGCDPMIFVVPKFDEDAGRMAAERILGSGKDVTAIFAANDLLAIGVMQFLRHRGCAIPEEMAVVGFDNIAAAALVTPALSSVAQFQDRMGEAAFDVLLRRIEGRLTGPATITEMPFELILRESS